MSTPSPSPPGQPGQSPEHQQEPEPEPSAWRGAWRILTGSRRTLLAAPDLPALCELARWLRARCALACLAAFVLAFALVVAGWRFMPFACVPPLLFGLLALFVGCAVMAHRLGRLSQASLNPEYASNIAHLARINPACAAYVAQVEAQCRPFTRLDLDELGAIHLRTRKALERRP